MYCIKIEKENKTIQEEYDRILRGPKLLFFRNFNKAKEEAKSWIKNKNYIGYSVEMYLIDDFPCDCEDDIEKVEAKQQILHPLG